MTYPPEQRVVVQLYADGVAAVERVVGDFESADWERPACGDWSAADTARHLLAVVDWYHEWLDRAVNGDASVPFDADEFTERNASGVSARAHLAGPEAISAFGDRAAAYLDRAVPEWDTPFGYPLGSSTVGLHVGIAATEWHLHAWDLSRGSEVRHEPQDAASLFTAAGFAVAATEGAVRGRLTRLAVPVAAKRAPWKMMLARSGRS